MSLWIQPEPKGYEMPNGDIREVKQPRYHKTRFYDTAECMKVITDDVMQIREELDSLYRNHTWTEVQVVIEEI